MTLTAKSILEYLRANAPTLYTVLHRPITGQGGFQSMLRRCQTEMGITPNEMALFVTPSKRTVLHEEADERRNETPTGRVLPPLPVTQPDLDREHATVQAARLLQRAGQAGEANRLLASLVGGQAEQAEQADNTSGNDEYTASVRDLDDVMQRARDAKQEKATLRAAGRKRKSPKVTAAGTARRTYRMLLIHHDPRVAGRKMREKFGDDWKALLK